MARRFGIAPATAREQLQKLVTPAATETFKPFPAPTGPAPFRATPAQLGVTDASPLHFFVLGDSGGIMNPTPQNNVSNAMQAQPSPGPAFVYHVGDVIYFNGDQADYPSQFYEPYAHLNVAVIGIPGNHDGDNSNDTSVPSLSAYMANFCATAAQLPPGGEEFNRDTETQPNCYWTLRAKAVTIVGLYTNVPSGGVVQSGQADWLAAELAAAPAGPPLIVTLHHPPYSVDAFHGGSAAMGQVLDTAIAAAKRTPDLILSGHVHNYQRFTRTLTDGSTLPYVVSGNGGYHNLHKLAAGATPGQEVGDGVVFEAGDDANWGFMTFTADAGKLSARYVRVAPDGTVTQNADSFTAGG
ncbi:MAG TPA: metallophosphoesterase [Solirubrobacteraceae bacterium]|jgi:predicted phosphodiesterase|nr:metallophosphoesterase [Solirubrobacteraceae bacterium]